MQIFFLHLFTLYLSLHSRNAFTRRPHIRFNLLARKVTLKSEILVSEMSESDKRAFSDIVLYREYTILKLIEGLRKPTTFDCGRGASPRSYLILSVYVRTQLIMVFNNVLENIDWARIFPWTVWVLYFLYSVPDYLTVKFRISSV